MELRYRHGEGRGHAAASVDDGPPAAPRNRTLQRLGRGPRWRALDIVSLIALGAEQESVVRAMKAGDKVWYDAGFAKNTKTNRWHVVLRTPDDKRLYSTQSFETREQALKALEQFVKEKGATIEPFL